VEIHTAAQPSHDWAAKEPMTDFSINATGTMNLLETTRLNCPDATFIFTSTNKVYGDTPNNLHLVEKDSRWEIDMLKYNDYQLYSNGIGTDGSINENMSIDHTKHSIFGASKVAADVMVQEYGRYFGMKTVVFRGGCLTGPNHAGAELHGFLSYLVKCIVNDKPYTIFGYKGKQVRDNIHSWDLVNMFWEFHQNPKQGEVYNVGGGRDNSISILETINYVNEKLNKNWDNFKITDTPRVGDHIWYVTDLNKFKKDYPEWNIKYSVYDTIDQIIEKNLEKI
jgi:CDP-paratose 2-epimerase